MKEPCVYIMANHRNGTIYTGVTGRPLQRFCEHREGWYPVSLDSMAAKIWSGVHETMHSAITQESRLRPAAAPTIWH